MLSAYDLLSPILRFRADSIAFVVSAFAAAEICREYLRRRGAAKEFSGVTCVTVVAFAGAGALLADGATMLLGYPAPAAFTAIMLVRAAVLGVTALVGAVLLTAAARLALLRAELRAHADAGRQLQEAKVAADEANRAKSDFLAVMSHEIRTPLNAVMGFASLLAESRLDDAQRGYVTTIMTEGGRLGSLINDILDLTKIEKGRLILERLPFAPAETVQEVLRLLSPRALAKHIELRFEAQVAGALLVAGDPLRFRQVIVNLVDNAIKFTPQGSVTVFMKWNPPTVEGTQHGELEMRVTDTGIGIAPEKLKDLFQMFMQADTSTTRRYGGTGLGLAICQRLVALMGGEIGVRSTQGKGSEFSFTLPLPLFAHPTELSSVERESARPRTQTPRVLIVDDLETNRLLLEYFLRDNGFEPQVASGGEEAVRLAAENHYDAILMDLQMPDVDGYEATRRIRAVEPRGRHALIIALTASVAKGTRERCLAAGMDEHLTKPLDLRRFKVLLNTMIDRTTEMTPLIT